MIYYGKSARPSPKLPPADLESKSAGGFENPPVSLKTRGLWTKSRHWGGGGNGLGRHLVPPPRSKEFFFLPHSP
jgi:hypothetical protein